MAVTAEGHRQVAHRVGVVIGDAEGEHRLFGEARGAHADLRRLGADEPHRGRRPGRRRRGGGGAGRRRRAGDGRGRRAGLRCRWRSPSRVGWVGVASPAACRAGRWSGCPRCTLPSAVRTRARTVTVLPCWLCVYLMQDSASPGCGRTEQRADVARRGASWSWPGLVTDTPATGLTRLKLTGTPSSTVMPDEFGDHGAEHAGERPVAVVAALIDEQIDADELGQCALAPRPAPGWTAERVGGGDASALPMVAPAVR